MRLIKYLTLTLLFAGSGLHAVATICIHYIDDDNYLWTELITEKEPADLRELLWKSEEFEAEIDYYDSYREASDFERADGGLRVLAAMLEEVNASGDAWAYLRSLKVNEDQSLEIMALIVDEGGQWELTQVIPLRKPTVFICN